MHRVPSPPAEPLIDEQQILRQIGFRNATELDETRTELRPAMKTAEGLPPWLVGLHYRLSPSVFDVEYLQAERVGGSIFGLGGEDVIKRLSRPFNHLFDAIPALQRFEIGTDGRVFYSSKVLGRRVLESWQGAHGSVPTSKNLLNVQHSNVGWKLGMKWDKQYPLPGRQEAVIGSSIVSGFPLGPYHGAEGRLVLHQEGVPVLQEVDFQSPTAKDIFAYSSLNRQFQGTPCSRPVFEPESGALINVLVDYGKTADATYRVIEIRPEAREPSFSTGQVGTLIAKFKAPPALVNSFCLTPNYVVIPIYPLTYTSKNVPSVFKDGGLIDGLYDRLHWNPQGDTLFYVISRLSKCLVAVYRSQAAFAFHTANAFESDDGDTLFLDICAYDDDQILSALELKYLRSAKRKHALPTPTLRRYTLPMLREEAAAFYGAAGQLPLFPTASFHTLVKQGIEAPVIHPSFVGTQARIVYGLGIKRVHEGGSGVFWNAIIKTDPLYPHDIQEWSETGCFPSPPVLIPRPNDPREDAGVLITTVLDVLRKRSFLAIIDAESMCDLGRFWLPDAISPSLLSGCWLQSLTGPETLPEELCPA